jgi:hypothetical protein
VWTVLAALVPKPRKIRKSADQLFLDVLMLRPLIDMMFARAGGASFSFARRFDSGTAYKREILSSVDFDRAYVPHFMGVTSFPRHIGVATASLEGRSVFDIVLDATEVERTPQRPRVLAVVARGVPVNSRAAVLALQPLALYLKCPLLLGLPIVQPPPQVAPPQLPALPA